MKPDPWAFQRWAHNAKTGSTPRKTVLLMLAVLADATTGRCEAKQETLAQAIEGSERTVRNALTALVDAGLIARRAQRRLDGTRRNDEILLLAPWVDEWPDGEPLPQRPDQPAGDAGGSTGSSRPHQPAAHDHINRHEVPGKNSPTGTTENLPSGAKENKARKEARASMLAQQLPDDFPADLIEHARIVFRLLRDLAVQHNARMVTPRAVGLTITAFPGRRYVSEARALAAWAQAPPRPILDVVATYRTWLKKADVHAGVESLGPPTAAAIAASPAGRARMHPADLRDLDLAALADQMKGPDR